MKDLVCVVADKQIKATIERLLRRPLSLGIRPIIRRRLPGRFFGTRRSRPR